MTRIAQDSISKERILKIQASLTAHWHDKGADWRGLAKKERKKTGVPNEDGGGEAPPVVSARGLQFSFGKVRARALYRFDGSTVLVIKTDVTYYVHSDTTDDTYSPTRRAAKTLTCLDETREPQEAASGECRVRLCVCFHIL